jgi:Meiotically Up-regulated Gene 113 (MUG113) protein
MNTESSTQGNDDPDTRSRDSGAIPVGQGGETKRKRRQAVYFIQCNGDDGPVKIGIAVDPNRRLSELRIGCPYPMRLLGVGAFPDADLAERALHARFHNARIHGEWFKCGPVLLEYAANMDRITARAEAEGVYAAIGKGATP